MCINYIIVIVNLNSRFCLTKKLHNCKYYKETLQPVCLSLYFSPQERNPEIFHLLETPGILEVLRSTFSIAHISLIRRGKNKT